MLTLQKHGLILTALSVLPLFGGCADRPAPVSDPTTQQPVAEVPDLASATPQERAVKAKDTLFGKLSTRLLTEMSRRGPAEAVEVCHKIAPQLAQEVGQSYGVRIGRTGVRLRNPQNVPPEWAKPLLESLPMEPVFTELPDQQTGALFPIVLKVQCLTCHGPEDRMADDILAKLKELYPEDRATGFQEGDLRGWFWVEVPAADSQAQFTPPDSASFQLASYHFSKAGLKEMPNVSQH